MTSKETETRNTLLELYRFIFSIIILLFHSRYLYGGTESLFRNGSIFVEPFFIISGFMMALSSKNTNNIEIGKQTRIFILKKLRRIILPTTISFLIGYVLLVIFNGLDKKVITFAPFEILFLDGFGLRLIRINAATWYLSAMLISLFILYPLYLKNRDVFINILGPLLMLFILGYLFKETQHLRAPSEWTGLVFKGTLRGIAITINGILLFAVCERLQGVAFTKLAKIIATLLRVILLLFTLIYAHYEEAGAKDFVCVILFSVILLSVFLRLEVKFPRWINNLFSALGKYSFYIYISHFYLITVLKTMLEGKSYQELLVLYILCTVVNSIIIILITAGIRKIKFRNLKSLFVKI